MGWGRVPAGEAWEGRLPVARIAGSGILPAACVYAAGVVLLPIPAQQKTCVTVLIKTVMYEPVLWSA